MKIFLSIFLLFFITIPSYSFYDMNMAQGHRSLSIYMFPTLGLKSYAWGLSYQKDDVGAYLSSDRVSGVYLFGVNKKRKVTDWFTMLLGFNGQKGGNDWPITLGFGTVLGWDLWGIKLNVPGMFSYYSNGFTYDYGLTVQYERLLLGMRGIMWYIPGQRRSSLMETYWTIGAKYNL